MRAVNGLRSNKLTCPSRFSECPCDSVFWKCRKSTLRLIGGELGLCRCATGRTLRNAALGLLRTWFGIRFSVVGSLAEQFSKWTREDCGQQEQVADQCSHQQNKQQSRESNGGHEVAEHKRCDTESANQRGVDHWFRAMFKCVSDRSHPGAIVRYSASVPGQEVNRVVDSDSQCDAGRHHGTDLDWQAQPCLLYTSDAADE